MSEGIFRVMELVPYSSPHTCLALIVAAITPNGVGYPIRARFNGN
jgi:hypothetical protein